MRAVPDPSTANPAAVQASGSSATMSSSTVMAMAVGPSWWVLAGGGRPDGADAGPTLPGRCRPVGGCAGGTAPRPGGWGRGRGPGGRWAGAGPGPGWGGVGSGGQTCPVHDPDDGGPAPAGEGTVVDPARRADLVARARAWAAADPDPATRAEVERLLADGDADALAAAFDGDLAFGTSGLRAPLGAGPRRMNRAVVRRVAAGLAAHLTAASPASRGATQAATPASVGAGPGSGPTVVVGHDARHGSARFAEDVADVLGAAGLAVVLVAGPQPTPVVVWTGTRLGAVATVVVTASHNPPTDNGVKIYLGDGAQPVPPVDAALAGRIAAVDPSELPPVGAGSAGVSMLGDEALAAYVAHVVALLPAGPREVSVVHTALHGVGWPVLRRAFVAAGFPEPVPVGPQAQPDPAFPTTPYPNPEEQGALDAAVAVAVERGADAVIANDPDADRLAVAVPAPPWGDGAAVPVGDGTWVRLTGNQLGWLLADHLLTGGEGDDRLVVSTFESSRLLARLAAEQGVHHVDVPTGFKWIVRPAAEHPELRFVLGYEEALGYSVDGQLRDKDGIAAALVVAELLAGLRAAGATVWDRLADLARRLGHHATATRWWVADDRASVDGAMARLRHDRPDAVGGRTVVEVEDLADGHLGHPADAVVLHLEGRGRLVVRPSGTEPKLKAYAEVVQDLDPGPDAFADAERSGGAAAAALADAVLDDLRA